VKESSRVGDPGERPSVLVAEFALLNAFGLE